MNEKVGSDQIKKNPPTPCAHHSDERPKPSSDLKEQMISNIYEKISLCPEILRRWKMKVKSKHLKHLNRVLTNEPKLKPLKLNNNM